MARLLHVTDDAVRDDEEDEVLLREGDSRCAEASAPRSPASPKPSDPWEEGSAPSSTAAFLAVRTTAEKGDPCWPTDLGTSLPGSVPPAQKPPHPLVPDRHGWPLRRRTGHAGGRF